MFTCPICKKEASDRTSNGRERKTCGSRRCVKNFQNRKLKAESWEYYCQWCNKTKTVSGHPTRETCGDIDCVRKRSNHCRAEKNRLLNPDAKIYEKPAEIDKIPIEDLQADYPTFYGLLKINKTKIVRCLKCQRTFESTSGHRICAECTRQNTHVGMLAYE